ncbi:UDP-N-acetylmuramoyl-L-alanyl-D-glutamate--2,6-diaminopimelate ligase [Acetobacteraceae bacterium ESL0709]|nr:UDP-N-acetylmuramoyl-L-alanyl-D-glutamate--2,6-diaminopimelate ligase [Acetobacteraceae bacterium ESL0697]MDF7678379.1 UDP-N-acetylmuramoyl-L-alanyl-D-glutamate--2,6-diaminopimelate ligase [Acetobacteraceae bacterium ESL0709]
MLLSALLHHLGISSVLQHDVIITDITADSRTVQPGSLFVALKGSQHDGAAYIPHAIFEGAVAIIRHKKEGTPTILDHYENGQAIPMIAVENPARFLALAAMKLAGSSPDMIAAVTGTNGKSSTVDFVRQIWQKQNVPAASIGTLGLITDADLPPLPPLTTPDSVSLAKALAGLKKAGIEHVALEASSHGIIQSRLDGLTIGAAGFSNLTRDHLDYHGTLSAYRDAKLRLFREILTEGGISVFNADMDTETVSALRVIAEKRHLKIRDIGRKNGLLTIKSIQPTPTGQIVTIAFSGRTLPPLSIPLVGSFQVENALMAAALCWKDDEDAPEILSLLSQLENVPGRCELVATLPHNATAYIDYAHTPDALEHILLSLRAHTKGKITLVFGAGGDRDKGKRPLMGQIAARLADRIIITDDNPRREDPALIRQEIKNTCPQAQEIPSRHDAIAEGLHSLQEGDILLVAGKGHEKGQITGDEVLPFDDRDVTRTLAKEIYA